MDESRLCVICGSPFSKRLTEPRRHFDRRKTCSPECWKRQTAANNRVRNVARSEPIHAKTCVVCGASFVWEGKQKAGDFRKKRKTCSDKCSRAYIGSWNKKEPPTRNCVVCGALFEHVQGSRKITCSPECRAKKFEANRLNLLPPKWCVVCGIEFTRRADEESQSYRRRRTCSEECRRMASGMARRKVIERAANPYPAEWNKDFKDVIRERDGHICQLCGVPPWSRKHAVHHIDYDKEHCHPENLITLCLSCHAKTNAGDPAEWMELFRSLLIERAA